MTKEKGVQTSSTDRDLVLPQEKLPTPGHSASGHVIVESVPFGPFVPLSPLPPRGYLVLKRIMDIVFSVLGLILTAPIWAIIPILIKLEDGGPAFYSQERLGLAGRRFRILKFRSMVQNAEKSTGPVWASENDHRVTRIGRLMRNSALDELPQLLNILRGDISFVGPRAERPELVEGFSTAIPGYRHRFRVRPGLTGLAQVHGRYDTHPRNKLRYEEMYIRRQDLRLDLSLITMSILISLTGKWESRQKKVRRR